MFEFLRDPKVPIIAGHSHCTCLGVPLQSLDGSAGIVPLSNGDARFCGFTGKWPREPAFFKNLAEAVLGRIVFLVWEGNQHAAQFLLMPGRPIDFVLAEDPALPVGPESEIVPDQAIDAALAEGTGELVSVIRNLREQGAARIILSGTPPPRGDVTRLRQAMLVEAYYFGVVADRLGMRLEDVPIAPPLFMKKAWAVIQRHLRASAEVAGAEFLSVPESTMSDGCLRDDLCAPDATHANESYGSMLRDHFAAYLDRGLG